MTGLLIDDDPLVVQTIEHFVEKCALVETCRHAADVATAINLMASSRPDFVLLDLHLPDLPGQSVLVAVPPEVPVVVVTSDPDFGAASYRYPNIVDYVVKPIDYVAFHRAVERAIQYRVGAGSRSSVGDSVGRPGRVIFIKSGTEILRLLLDEIRMVKAEANYVSFHQGKETRPVLALTTLKHIAEQLPGSFLRVHRSYIVNRDHVERVDGHAVHVGGTAIPLGESFRADFLAKLGIIA